MVSGAMQRMPRAIRLATWEEIAITGRIRDGMACVKRGDGWVARGLLSRGFYDTANLRKMFIINMLQSVDNSQTVCIDFQCIRGVT